MRAGWLAVFLAASTAAFGAEGEFDHVVKAIESHYGTTRTHIPFIGLASFAVKLAHPAGTSDFKLAIFEDLKSRGDRDQMELDQFMSQLSSASLHPVVRARSRRDRESTYIFAGEAGRSTRVLIATFERNEATVIEVKVDVNTLLKWLNQPEDAAKSAGPRHEW